MGRATSSLCNFPMVFGPFLEKRVAPARCIQRGVEYPTRIVYAYGVNAFQGAIALAGSQAELAYMLVPMAVTGRD